MDHNKYIKQTVPVKGMHCASCAMTVQKTLKKTDGVIACEVNYGNEKIKIEFDPAKTNLEELSKRIEPFGYSLTKGTGPTHIMPDDTIMADHDMEGMDHSAHLGIGQSKEEKLKELSGQKKKVLFVMPITAVVFVIMLWDIARSFFVQIYELPIPMEIYQRVSLIFAAIVLFWIGGGFLKEVITFVKYRVANMYTLVGIGTFTAYFYSAIITLFPEIKMLLELPDMTYFDVTIVVIGFIYLGKYLETRSKLITGEAIEKLLNLQAKTALIERDGKEIEIPVEQVVTGDIIVIKPGSKIPLDGEIIEGNSSIDESMITGEPIPVDKNVGDIVIGGTINKQGHFKFKTTKVGSETVLSQIIRMVDEAQGSRAPIQGLADKISEIFVPVVLVISLVTLIGWLGIGSLLIPFNEALSIGILCFTGVLVIACPCALGLATPTAIIVGTGKGAENGILIKDAESLEKLHKVNTIVTDKTGTLTKGKPEVTEIIPLSGKPENDLLQLIASLEKKSEHPLAEAIVNKAEESNIDLLKVENFGIIEGQGLKGVVDSEEYYAGNIKLAEKLGLKADKNLIDDLALKGKTPVILMSKKEIIGLIGISDTLKENAKETVEALHKMGIKVIMLTGDNKSTAKYIAERIGIDEIIAEVLPQDKADKVKEIQNKGNTVAMVGDGVNDAPALAQANVGIAMSTGTDIAIESASITLLRGDFSKVLQAIKLSKFTIRAIKQNLFWAFAYNIVGIPIATGLFYPFFGLLLNPVFAGLAMAFSSVSVVANSLRLKSKKL